MGPLQLTVTWYKIRHAGEQATHWDMQDKATSSSSIFFMLPLAAKGPLGLHCNLSDTESNVFTATFVLLRTIIFSWNSFVLDCKKLGG